MSRSNTGKRFVAGNTVLCFGVCRMNVTVNSFVSLLGVFPAYHPLMEAFVAICMRSRSQSGRISLI